jgi:hypothetical protein
MPSQNALKLADELIQDFRGNGYYADPALLAERLSSSARGVVIQQSDVIELFRFLLKSYASGQDHGKREEFAKQLDTMLRLTTP